MKDTSELDRRRGTETELDPGSTDKTRKPGTDDQPDPQNQSDDTDNDDESGEVDDDGELTNDELGES